MQYRNNLKLQLQVEYFNDVLPFMLIKTMQNIVVPDFILCYIYAVTSSLPQTKISSKLHIFISPIVPFFFQGQNLKMLVPNLGTKSQSQFFIPPFTQSLCHVICNPSHQRWNVLHLDFGFDMCLVLAKCFPFGSDGKEIACNAGDPSLIPGLGRSPVEGNGYPLQYSFWPGEFHGLCSPQGRKELDTTE